MTNKEYEKYLKSLSDNSLTRSIEVLKRMSVSEKNSALLTVESLAVEELNSRRVKENENA